MRKQVAAIFKVLERFISLPVFPEMAGLDRSEAGVTAYPEFPLNQIQR